MASHPKICLSVNARGKNFQYWWHKNDVPIPASDAKYHGTERESTLEIGDVTKDDEGEYHCQVWQIGKEINATNSLKSTLRLSECIKKNFKLCVYNIYIYWYDALAECLIFAAEYLPSIIEQPKCFKAGEAVKITIHAEPSKSLSYIWRNEHGDLLPDDRCSGVQTPELTIFEANEEDAWWYYCRVSNSAEFYVDSTKVKLGLSEYYIY